VRLELQIERNCLATLFFCGAALHQKSILRSSGTLTRSERCGRLRGARRWLVAHVPTVDQPSRREQADKHHGLGRLCAAQFTHVGGERATGAISSDIRWQSAAANIFVYTNAHAHMYTYFYIYAHVRTRTRTHTRTHTHPDTHTHTHRFSALAGT
jgi:hypothetical protein